MLTVYRRRIPPSPVESVPCKTYDFFFSARKKDSPEAIKVYTRNALQMYESLVHSANEEVSRRIDQTFEPERTRELSNLSSMPLTTINAVIVGDNALVLVQFWRSRDTIKTKDRAFVPTSGASFPEERILPTEIMRQIKAVYDTLWDNHSFDQKNKKSIVPAYYYGVNQ